MQIKQTGTHTAPTGTLPSLPELAKRNVAKTTGAPLKKMAALAVIPALLVGGLFTFDVNAYEKVEVDGDLYACQNHCQVDHMQNGAYTVRDSQGGWTAKIEVDGGAIYTPGDDPDGEP